MRKIGRCDCGEMGIKIKIGDSVCERCDRIERTVHRDLFKLSEEEKQRNLDNKTLRYSERMYLE